MRFVWKLQKCNKWTFSSDYFVKLCPESRMNLSRSIQIIVCTHSNSVSSLTEQIETLCQIISNPKMYVDWRTKPSQNSLWPNTSPSGACWHGKDREALRTRGQSNTDNTRPACLGFLSVVCPQRQSFLEPFISAAACEEGSQGGTLKITDIQISSERVYVDFSWLSLFFHQNVKTECKNTE